MAKETGLGVTTLSVDDSAAAVKTIVNDITELEDHNLRAMLSTNQA